MLTAKEIDEIPKGKYSNIQLAQVFKRHGKQSRQMVFPCDIHGNALFGHKEIATKFHHNQLMRLNRQQFRRYSKKS